MMAVNVHNAGRVPSKLLQVQHNAIDVLNQYTSGFGPLTFPSWVGSIKDGISEQGRSVCDLKMKDFRYLNFYVKTQHFA